MDRHNLPLHDPHLGTFIPPDRLDVPLAQLYEAHHRAAQGTVQARTHRACQVCSAEKEWHLFEEHSAGGGRLFVSTL